MSSLLTSTRQVSADSGYYISLASLVNKIVTYQPTRNPEISQALWCSLGSSGGTAGAQLSTLNAAGALLKDMGKTVVSAGRTFRKVQLVVSAPALSTGGVSGQSATVGGEDYYTGYVELGINGTGQPAPVAQFGR